ncbi:MAG: hypothetical protein LBK18_01215 [Prevotellaceae bacterium]|nr:hypothetical protein [Prevotellaceae bacterium]
MKKKGRILLIFTIASAIAIAIAYYCFESKPKVQKNDIENYPQNATLV